jgi:diguanylate cyclase (GGDEF)-like protein/PAS domain S-box-containing protein
MNAAQTARAPLALVVDDDPSVRMRARLELAAAGFRVAEAATGEDGLRAVERGAVDLVVLDVQLPGADGFATCRAIRNLPGGEDLPVLMVTGSEDLASVERAFQAGATDFATKPIHWPLLRHRARFLVRAGDTFRRLQRTLVGLSESERRLSDAQRLAHVGNWQWLGEAGQMLWSDEAFRILGYDPGEIDPSRDALRGAVHPEDRALFDKTLDEALASRVGWSIEHRLQTASGAVRFVQHQGAVDVDPLTSELRVLGTLQDVTDRRTSEEKIRRLAFYDSLTGLPNRRLLRERLERTLRFARDEHCQVALLFVDVDRFKWVNDSLGHAAGDRLLSEVAARLVDSLRLGDGVFRPVGAHTPHFLSRVGGDEFVVTLLMRDDPENAAKVSRRILARLAEPLDLDGREIAVTASIGIAVFPTDAGDVDTLMRQADAAMYHAKSSGRNRYQFYTPALGEAAERALSVQSGLKRGLDEEAFVLEYQPQIDVRSGRALVLEALVRWNAPGRGLVGPGEFVAIAEETGLIQALGAWVLRRACQDCRAWQADGFPGMGVAVNLSPMQLRRPEIVGTIARTLEETGLAARHLELELTESALLEHTATVAQNLEQLHAMGVRLALDDFGTGYASLAYLKRVRFDTLKIDRAFIRDISVDAGDRAIVSAVVAIGRTFGLRVIAEGVENAEQERLVRSEGCDAMQGFWLGRPAGYAAVVEFLRNRAA